MINANIGKRAQRFDVISNFRCGDSEGGRYGVAEVAHGEHLLQPFTASHLFECVLESGVCCYLVLHRRRCLLAWQMTRHVLLSANLSERLRGGDGKFKQTTSEVGQTHKFLEREASITVRYTHHCYCALHSVGLTEALESQCWRFCSLSSLFVVS
jgi:hypothetical protein